MTKFDLWKLARELRNATLLDEEQRAHVAIAAAHLDLAAQVEDKKDREWEDRMGDDL